MSEQENPSDKTIQRFEAIVIESTAFMSRGSEAETTEDEDLRPKTPAPTPGVANVSAERYNAAANKLASHISKRRDVAPAVAQTSSKDTNLQMDEIIVMTCQRQSIHSIPMLGKEASEGKFNEKNDVDSITTEFKERETPEVAKITSEWSDEEEAGGLPRSNSRSSRSSRVSRCVRQWFCCGLQLEAPSEDNESSTRDVLNAI